MNTAAYIDKLEALEGSLNFCRNQALVAGLEYLKPVFRSRLRSGRNSEGDIFGRYKSDDKQGRKKGEIIDFYQSGELLDGLIIKTLKGTPIQSKAYLAPSGGRIFAARELKKLGYDLFKLSAQEAEDVSEVVKETYLNCLDL